MPTNEPNAQVFRGVVAFCILTLALPTVSLVAEPYPVAERVTTYLVKGILLESRTGGHTAVITHESIPGYMDAMTMPFNIKNPAELKGLQAGDRITFRLSVTKQDAWISEIKKEGGSDVIRRSVLPQEEVGLELRPGALVRDCVLTNQAGQALRLRDFKGQALAFTFFFTRCPLPTLCPRMNNNFNEVQRALQSDASGTNWQLLSVSFDPKFDTPEFLNSFAQAHQSDPHHWSFATSSPEEIQNLGGAFGLKFWRENGSFSHNLRTVVVDASCRVQKVFRGNEWQPAELVLEMKKAMMPRP